MSDIKVDGFIYGGKVFNVKIDGNDIKSFNHMTDRLFAALAEDLADPLQHEPIVKKVASDIRNSGLGFTNHPKWAEVKQRLKEKGFHNNTNALNLTGNLANDFRFKVISKSPDEILSEYSFSDVPRMRPTMQSLQRASRSTNEELQYIPISSREVVRILQSESRAIAKKSVHSIKPYPVMDRIYTYYSDDILYNLSFIVEKAFARTKR